VRKLLVLLLLVAPAITASAWRILYVEQYYALYHEQLHHYPDDSLENVHYLELALDSAFANPLYALAPIHDKTEWERYKDLFSMHLNVMLVYSWLQIGAKYDKQVANFYNAPWKEQNLESLKTAEAAYKAAYGYWAKAQEWSTKAWAMRSIRLEKVDDWQDENWRIQTGDLDYKGTIDRQLARLAKVRADFRAMNASTY
jgi:hypothetical protein